MYGHIKSEVGRKFPEHTYKAVCSFLFLRFICPAILAVSFCLNDVKLIKLVKATCLWTPSRTTQPIMPEIPHPALQDPTKPCTKYSSWKERRVHAEDE